MSALKVAVLGVGNIRCSVPVIASLATFFGERPLEIAFYDSDEERLDLFDRFARLCFLTTRVTHSLRSTADPAEALEGAEVVLVQMDENCARKLLSKGGNAEDPTQESLDLLLELVPEGATVMNLMHRPIPREEYYETDWPPALTGAEQDALPLYLLRLLNGEEFVYEILRANEASPLKQWLNNPSRAG
jgi:hypothetical protein